MHVIRGNRMGRALGHREKKKDRKERRVGGVLTCANTSMSEQAWILYGPAMLGNFLYIF